jgi:hypothetical protein
VVTPDAGSLTARLFGWKWWHFRVAHIGYFNRKNFLMALDKAGFELIKIYRPSWYFSADYIFDRLKKYMPQFMQLSTPPFLKNFTIPLNLRDSLLGIFMLKSNGNGRK